MRLNTVLSAVSLTFLATLLTVPAKAVVLYEDDFSGSTPDARWQRYENDPLTGLLLENGTFRIGPQNDSRVVCISFPEVTLGIGDSLSVSFKIQAKSVATASKTFRYGFFNSLNDSAPDSGDRGYFTGVEWASTTTTNSTVSCDTGTNLRFMAGSDILQLKQASTAYGITAITDWYSCEFILTGVSGGVSIISHFAGEEISFTESNFNITKLNRFAVQEYQGKAIYFMDDVAIQLTTIPEPSTYGLFAGGILAMICGLAKRKRRQGTGEKVVFE